MGATCLGKPRSHRELMTNQETIEKRYQSYQSTKVNDQKVAAQSQGNRLKINRSLFVCSVCMQNYNTNEREPILACHNQHTYCKQCLLAVQKTNKKCPQCRQNLLPPAKNRYIFQLVEDNIKSLQQGNIQPISNKTPQVIKLTINTQTYLVQNFWIEGNKIMKIQDDKIWQGFVSKQTILRDRQCIFFIKIIHSKFNNIQIGVVGKGYIMEKNVTCPQSVVYHLADGNVLGGIEGRSNQWRKTGQKIAPGSPIQIEVRVSIPTKTILWLSDGKQLANARLSDFLFKHQCVAYFLMCHKEDIVQFNG